ncbi:hypothetical protein EDC96DRAFT_548239 [Choanephora cucurbitarum]|nr:hypothetical protein EDC96DRAFT_548238 [Choanephora cucurbitarum]KAI8334921.1 hypothetical protein EDC96DRAFT_548239 [Choanephora cucurbitarum]
MLLQIEHRSSAKLYKQVIAPSQYFRIKHNIKYAKVLAMPWTDTTSDPGLLCADKTEAAISFLLHPCWCPEKEKHLQSCTVNANARDALDRHNSQPKVFSA